MKEKKEIRIVDAPTGAGKTTALIHILGEKYTQFKDDHKERFICVSPYIKEIETNMERLKGMGVDVTQPTRERGKGKELIGTLLPHGENVFITHELLQRSFYRICDTLTAPNFPYKYSLFIDEEPTVLQELQEKTGDSETDSKLDRLLSSGLYVPVANLSEKDLDNMEALGLLLKGTEDSPHRLYTNPYDNTGTIYDSFRDFFKRYDVYGIKQDNKLKLNYFIPADFWSCFDTVTVMSYRTEYSFFNAYCNLSHLPITFYHVNEDMTAFVKGLKRDKPKGLERMIVETIPDSKSYKGYELSYSWYHQKATQKDMKRLKDNMSSFSRDYKSATVLWSTFKDAERKLSNGKKGLTKNNFLAHKALATNDYDSKTVIIYGVNKCLNPFTANLWKTLGQPIDADNWSLSLLIQFIWRSNIRVHDSNSHIHLYLPSERMRNLFTQWLEE